MALPAPSYAPATFTYDGYQAYGTPSTPTWDPSTLASHFNTMSLQAPQEWVMDTGASAHMSSDAGSLNSLSSNPPHKHIMVGDGSSIPVSHSGHASIFTSSPHLTLRDVLVTPRIVKNLISIRQFTLDNLCSVEFDPWGFSVKDLRTGAVILRCSSSGDLYPVTTLPHALTALTADSTLWHRRLGHPGPDAFLRLVSSSSLPINKVHKGFSLCHACQLGRHVRLPFSPSTTRTLRPLELIHCDLWTSPIESVSGYKYFLVILDNFTHYLWTYPLRKKSEVFPFYLTSVLMLPHNFLSPFKPFSVITDVNSTAAPFRTSPPHMGFFCASRVLTLPHKMVKPNVSFALLTT